MSDYHKCLKMPLYNYCIYSGCNYGEASLSMKDVNEKPKCYLVPSDNAEGHTLAKDWGSSWFVKHKGKNNNNAKKLVSDEE